MSGLEANPGAAASPHSSPPVGVVAMFKQIVRRSLGGGEPFQISETALLIAISLFMAIAHNTVFFGKVFELYPLGTRYLLFHTGLVIILVGLTAFLLALVSSKYTTKPFVLLLLVSSAVVSYFVNTYGIVVDVDMLHNTLETNPAEALDLMSVKLVLHVGLLGVLPSVIVWRLRLDYGSFSKNLLKKFLVALGSLALIAAAAFSSASTMASFLREHKSVRNYVNPAGYVYAVGKLAGSGKNSVPEKILPYAEDARREIRTTLPRLVVMVVGETARADRFSLNGYPRETNPLLKREDIVNFPNVMSAGTSTSISVPSMFSHLGRARYDARVARRTENVLDILARVGVAVLWRDNNSDSKGVALRVAYEDFKSKERNPIYDGEARDEGMLVDLQNYLDRQPADVLIVLHAMGSHGPAYYKRYPKAFEVFTPVCSSNQLENCTPAEINNAYDNTILYTDYFLSKVIELLKRNDGKYETAMLYFSDHGESLGENNLYLHGYPYALAPIEQKHIPAVFWFGRHFPIDRAKIRAKAGEPYSHDNLFPTLLGLFNVKTVAYQAGLDMVSPFLQPPAAIEASAKENGAAAK